MQAVIKAPDIVFPYGGIPPFMYLDYGTNPSFNYLFLSDPGIKEYFKGKDLEFIVDLELSKKLRQSICGNNHSCNMVFSDLYPNIETAEYRLDVFQDLITLPKLRTAISSLTGQLDETQKYMSDARRDDRPHICYMVFDIYCNLLENLPSFCGAYSEGLRAVEGFLSAVAERDCTDIRRVLTDTEQAQKRLMEHIANKLKGLTADDEDQFWRDFKKPYVEQIVPGFWMKMEMLAEQYFKQLQEVVSLRDPLLFYHGATAYFLEAKKLGIPLCRPKLYPKTMRRLNVNTAYGFESVRRYVEKIMLEKPVPNEIAYSPEKNMFVITGPNSGGKTTYVQTVATVQYMASRGFYVFAKAAEVSLVDNIFTHFVKSEDIILGEGRYKNELRRVRAILEQATPYSLVILDEPCGGTSYEEGIDQSLIILEGLHRIGCATYFTTHLHAIATYVDKGGYSAAKNLYAEWKKGKERSFRVYIEGKSGWSYTPSFYEEKKTNATWKIKHGYSTISHPEQVGLSSEQITKILEQRKR